MELIPQLLRKNIQIITNEVATPIISGNTEEISYGVAGDIQGLADGIVSGNNLPYAAAGRNNLNTNSAGTASAPIAAVNEAAVAATRAALLNKNAATDASALGTASGSKYSGPLNLN